jgi:hypothetical protein
MGICVLQSVNMGQCNKQGFTVQALRSPLKEKGETETEILLTTPKNRSLIFRFKIYIFIFPSNLPMCKNLTMMLGGLLKEGGHAVA